MVIKTQTVGYLEIEWYVINLLQYFAQNYGVYFQWKFHLYEWLIADECIEWNWTRRVKCVLLYTPRVRVMGFLWETAQSTVRTLSLGNYIYLDIWTELFELMLNVPVVNGQGHVRTLPPLYWRS